MTKGDDAGSGCCGFRHSSYRFRFLAAFPAQASAACYLLPWLATLAGTAILAFSPTGTRTRRFGKNPSPCSLLLAWTCLTPLTSIGHPDWIPPPSMTFYFIHFHIELRPLLNKGQLLTFLCNTTVPLIPFSEATRDMAVILLCPCPSAVQMFISQGRR